MRRVFPPLPPSSDYSNREQIAKLLRFRSTSSPTSDQDVPLTAYVERMKDGQDKIFYLLAPTADLAAKSPHLEMFAKKGIEVLLLGDEIDSWVVSSLPDFDGKRLQSVAQGDADLAALADDEEKEASEKATADFAALASKLKNALDGKAHDVRVSSRLTTSPACIVASGPDLPFNLPGLTGRPGGTGLPAQPVLEINPAHPLVARLNQNPDDPRLVDWANLLFSQAVLTLGVRLDDPGAFVSQLNDLLVDLAGSQSDSGDL